jgi:type 1 fimbria pilin
MKKIIIATTVLAALAPMSNAFAATFTAWSAANRVTIDLDRINIYIDGAVANPNGCSAFEYIALPATTANFDAMTAAVMSAVAGNFEIRMKIDETACFASHPKAIWVSFRN